MKIHKAWKTILPLMPNESQSSSKEIREIRDAVMSWVWATRLSGRAKYVKPITVRLKNILITFLKKYSIKLGARKGLQSIFRMG